MFSHAMTIDNCRAMIVLIEGEIEMSISRSISIRLRRSIYLKV